MWDEVYRDTYAFEDRHWWFRAQRRLSQWATASFSPPAPPEAKRLLDVGVGGGATLVALSAFGRTVGVDASEAAIGYARRRGEVGALIRASAVGLPFRPQQFDVVTILNVLCHELVRDDRAAIREAYRVLKPGGLLIVTDPAYDCIRRHHDIVEMTVRRYTVGRVTRNVRRAGFRVIRAGYMYSFLLPAILWQAVWDRLVRRHRRPTSDLAPPPPWLNRALDAVCRLELRLGRLVSPPFGTTVFCLARRP